MELQLVDVWKLLAAVGAGALVGLERELHDKPAGFRTNILICLGAALFTLISVQLAGDKADRTRIAAQIVTGVGFLGAGAIIQHRNHVIGLTTAATIWAVASLGMAFGAGEFELGGLGTVLTSGVLFGLGYAEASISRLHSVARFELELDPSPEAKQAVERLVRDAGVQRRGWTLSKTPQRLVGRLIVGGSASRLEKLEQALMQEKLVRAVKRL